MLEPDLAQRCSTSRTPVRKACMRLHQDRWLTRFPRKGFLVTPISVRDILDLYQFRKLLEGFAAEQVASAAGPAELAALAGNQRVLDQLGLVLAFSRRLDTLYMRVEHSWIPHHDLPEALERHDGPGSSRAMAAHLDHGRDCLVKLFGTTAPRLQ